VTRYEVPCILVQDVAAVELGVLFRLHGI
jgi:hypothetical protein